MDEAAIMASHREPVAGQAFKAGQLGSIKEAIKETKIASKSKDQERSGHEEEDIPLGWTFRFQGFRFRVQELGFRVER